MADLVTGALGFTGSYLEKHLDNKTLLLARNIPENYIGEKKVIQCDLLDAASVNKLIEKEQPEKIYHLAGSFTQDFQKDFNGNLKTTENILNSVKNYSPLTRILLVGSAAEYGILSVDDCPVNEDSIARPFNIYGLTKIYQKTLMDYYVNAFSLNIVMARPFNLYGKGLSNLLFIGMVYQEINSFKDGNINEISLGNLESQRDYISIEDAVKHYLKVMERGVAGEVYNVASGKPTKTKDLLAKILKNENLDFSIIKANTRPPQANDSDIIFANINKLEGLYND